MFKTLVGAFKNKDIRKKIIYTLLILVVVRVGSLLPIPGVDTNYFSSLLSGINTGDLSYLSAVTGGSFERMSLFALSITPYITSSIIMQLLTIAIPKLEEMQKEGEDGRKKIASITRYENLTALDILSEEICHLNRNMYLNENEQTKNIIRSTIKVYRLYVYAHRSCQ